MPTELHDPEIIIGEDNESFIVQQGQTMVFFVEENVLIEYLYRQYVVSDYPDTEFFRLDHLRLQGSQSSSFEIPSSLSVNLEARFLVRSLIDETKLQDILNGQLKQDLLPLLENQSDIDIAEVSLRPFWRKRIPEEVEHIHIRQKW